MIRFRFEADERRFNLLHAGLFRALAQNGLPDVAGSEALRNVGKIEQMAYFEGLRQGVAIAALAAEMVKAESGVPEPLAQKPFQLHALVYGSSDTPLREMEKEWLDRLGLDTELLSKSWLDDAPMRYAPTATAEPAPMISIQAPYKPIAVPFNPETSPGMTDMMVAPETIDPMAGHGAEITPLMPWERGEYESDEEKMPESPAFLDQVRDRLQTLKNSGWTPKTWPDLILGLHQHMQVDAAMLDLQLSTHVGRAVLNQCGIVDIIPPEMISMDDLQG